MYVICDNMAAHIMSKGLINIVIVGADRVAANGDIANKIGTMGVAISAKYFGIPFYVACPFSTIDMSAITGNDVIIEERGEKEVTHFGLKRTAPKGIKVRNPAFDVTPKNYNRYNNRKRNLKSTFLRKSKKDVFIKYYKLGSIKIQ